MEVVVPKQVQDQFDAAEAIRSKVYAPAPTEPPVVQTETPPEPPKQAEPVTTEPVQVVDPPKAEPNKDDEQRYRTLQAKYNAEVPRLYQQVKERDAQIRELTTRLESLEQKSETPKEDLTPTKDAEEFGEDLVAMVRRTAADEARKALGTFASELDKQLKAMFGQMGKLNERVEVNEAEKFWNRVTALVPDWDAVDNNESWVQFLDTTPDYTTETYRELAGKAIRAGDASKVAALVKIWRGEPAPQVQEPAKPKETLQHQVVPPTTRASTTLPAGQKIWTGPEYEHVFSPRAASEYPAKELAALQADANKAMVEGRIRW